MRSCEHPETEKVIDRLGLMREREGVLGAPVLDWHVVCLRCHAVLEVGHRADPDDDDRIDYAAGKVAEAIRAVREFRAGGQHGR
ncbi:MAG TPA: hypothetical protein VIT65_13810 [Microlunatus sp.]